MRCVHGIEVYNPHPLFNARFEKTLELAVQNKKIITAGSDFHAKANVGKSGMIVPDNIEDQFMLRDYLQKDKQIIFNKDGILYESI